MGPEHGIGDQGLDRGVQRWGLLFNLKILLAKESSYEFSPVFPLPSSDIWSHSAQVHLPQEATTAMLQFLLLGFLLVTRVRFGML